MIVSEQCPYYNADPVRARFFASNNLALPADRFHAIGGFETAFPLAAGEDREFCARWLDRGYRMTYAPEVVVHHAHTLTFRRFWRQQCNYGRGAFRFRRGYARREDGDGRREPASFYLNLLRYPFSMTRGWRAWSLAMLMGVSQGAIVAGYGEAWCNARRAGEAEAMA